MKLNFAIFFITMSRIEGYTPIDPESVATEVDNLLTSLKGMQDHLKYLESREIELPDILYHATTRRNVMGIREQGLEPKPLYFGQDEVVCLSDDAQFALEVVSETQREKVERLKLLAIDKMWLRRRDVRSYLRKEDSANPDPMKAAAIHEVHYSDVIDPRSITLQRFYYDKQTGQVALLDAKPLSGNRYKKHSESRKK